MTIPMPPTSCQRLNRVDSLSAIMTLHDVTVDRSVASSYSVYRAIVQRSGFHNISGQRLTGSASPRWQTRGATTATSCWVDFRGGRRGRGRVGRSRARPREPGRPPDEGKRVFAAALQVGRSDRDYSER